VNRLADYFVFTVFFGLLSLEPQQLQVVIADGGVQVLAALFVRVRRRRQQGISDVRFLGTIVTNLLAQIPRSTHLVVQALHDGGLREGAEVVLLDVDFVERLGVVLFAVLYVEGLRHREAPYRHFEVAERHLLAQLQDYHVHQIGVSTLDRLNQSWRVFRQFQQQLDLLARLGLVVQQFNGEFSAAELRRGARDLAVRDPRGVSQLLGDLSGHGLFL
jgi:hypothetical protein